MTISNEDINKANVNFKAILNKENIQYVEQDNIFYFVGVYKDFLKIFGENLDNTEELKFMVYETYFVGGGKITGFRSYNNSDRELSRTITGPGRINYNRDKIKELVGKFSSDANDELSFSSIDLQYYPNKTLTQLLSSNTIVDEKSWASRIEEENQKDKPITR